MTTKQLSKRLMSVFYTSVLLEIAIVTLYESEIILEGGMSGNKTAEFIVCTIMELLTIIVIPIALRMIKYGAVLNVIREKHEEGLYNVAMMRMVMLIIPMFVNTLCYYLFMNVAFAYLAIVLAISLFFIVPTHSRCCAELEIEE